MDAFAHEEGEMMEEIQRLVEAWNQGDVTASIPIADWFCDRDDTDGPNLARYARDVCHGEDFATCVMAMACFDVILKRKGLK